MRRLIHALVILMCCCSLPVFAGGFEYPGNPGQSDPGQGSPGQADPIDQTGQANPGQGDSSGCGQSDDYATSEATLTLLRLAQSDLELCRACLRASGGYVDNVLAIGYLNSAKSSLSRAALPGAYRPLIQELIQRVEKVRFYLLMNETQTCAMMLHQIGRIIASVADQQGGTTVYTVDPQQPTTITVPVGYYPTGIPSGYYPSSPSSWGYGQGQNLSPVGIPSHLTPTN